MKKFLKSLVVWLGIGIGGLWSITAMQQPAQPPVQHLAADSLQKILSKTDTAHLIILDVRPREKFDQGHLPGALSIPLEELPERLAELQRRISQNDTLVVYCGNGKRSARAAEILEKARLPVRVICNLKKGLQTWQGPMVKPQQKHVPQKSGVDR